MRLILGVLHDVFVVDHDQGREVFPSVSDDHGVVDVGAELELVFDFRRRDVLAARRDDDVLHPVRDDNVSVLVDASHVPGVQPAVHNGFGGFFGIPEISHEDGGALDEDFAVLGDPDLRAGHGPSHGPELGISRVMDGDASSGLGLSVDLPHVDAQGVVELQQIRGDGRRPGQTVADPVQAHDPFQVPQHGPVDQMKKGLQMQRDGSERSSRRSDTFRPIPMAHLKASFSRRVESFSGEHQPE